MQVGIGMELLRKHYQATSHVFIPGGADMDPQFYGQRPHPKLGFTNASRDRRELELARRALKDKKPLFGICRGHQVITVAAGGTLVQDIGSEIKGGLNHRGTHHWIDIDPHSRLARLLGETRIQVNSLHHQATKEVPPGWKAVAWAPDGVIEAIEPEDPGLPVISVQFHPEMMYQQDPRFARLFEWFMKQRRRQDDGQHQPGQ
jgi:putative glutamine amidotransferase